MDGTAAVCATRSLVRHRERARQRTAQSVADAQSHEAGCVDAAKGADLGQLARTSHHVMRASVLCELSRGVRLGLRVPHDGQASGSDGKQQRLRVAAHPFRRAAAVGL